MQQHANAQRIFFLQNAGASKAAGQRFMGSTYSITRKSLNTYLIGFQSLSDAEYVRSRMDLCCPPLIQRAKAETPGTIVVRVRLRKPSIPSTSSRPSTSPMPSIPSSPSSSNVGGGRRRRLPRQCQGQGQGQGPPRPGSDDMDAHLDCWPRASHAPSTTDDVDVVSWTLEQVVDMNMRGVGVTMVDVPRMTTSPFTPLLPEPDTLLLVGRAMPPCVRAQRFASALEHQWLGMPPPSPPAFQ
jgi:hypothetical protein